MAKRNRLLEPEPEPCPTNRSALDSLTVEALDIRERIGEHATLGTKLSAGAFLETAMRYAACDHDRLGEVEKKVEKRGGDAVRAFVRRLANEFLEARFPQPPGDALKFVRVYGREDLPGELAEIGVSGAEAIAVAAKHAITQAPNSFGQVENLAEHEQRRVGLQKALDAIYRRMRRAVSFADLVEQPLAVELRDKGYLLLRFKRAAGLAPVGPDWPSRYVDAISRKRVEVKKKAA